MPNEDAKGILGNESNEVVAARVLAYAVSDAGYDYDDAKGEINSLSYDGTNVTIEIDPDNFTPEFKSSLEAACEIEGIPTSNLIIKEE